MKQRSVAIERRRRRVAIIAPSAYLLGGVQTWLDYIVPGLERAGWDVTVLLVNGTYSDAHVYLHNHPFDRARLVTNATGSREGRIRALMRGVAEAKPDIVLCVNIVDAYEAVTRLQQRGAASLRIAMALHSLQPCFFDDIARFASSLDGVIATNRLAISVAVQLSGVHAARAHYAPCGVEVPDLPCVQPDESETLTLLFAGRFDADEKRVMDLPRIVEALERRRVMYHLRLAGVGPAEDALRSAMSQFGDKVEFLGVLDAAGMRAKLYVPGAILLNLSPSETGPLVAWEAMANGVAVVSSRFLGIGLEGGLIDGTNCLTFPVGDIESAADAIVRLRNPALRHALIVAGRMLVEQRYSRTVSIDSWDRALCEVLVQPRQGQSSLPGQRSADGRLDRLFGVGLAETIRNALGIRFRHAEAGGEWPHSYGRDDNSAFRAQLGTMDSELLPDNKCL